MHVKKRLELSTKEILQIELLLKTPSKLIKYGFSTE